MRKAIQCKDVDKVDVLRVIEKKSLSTIPYVMLWEIEDDFPDIPNKVILAKLRQMVRAGWITGCGCGCRGDFEIKSFYRDPNRRITYEDVAPIIKDSPIPVTPAMMTWLKKALWDKFQKEFWQSQKDYSPNNEGE